MVFKGIMVVLALVIVGGVVFVGGAETVSAKFTDYIEKNYKPDMPEYEDYTFKNAQYLNLTAKYELALGVLDKYDQRFDKEAQKEKSLFLRAVIHDGMMQSRPAKDLYERYIAEFPEGQNIKKAKERYADLKSYL
jgi:hypothetical protein